MGSGPRPNRWRACSRKLSGTDLGADWGLAETGATGPAGNRYGDAAGHACFAVAGRRTANRTLETGSSDRAANMVAFANTALELLEDALLQAE